MEFQKTPGVYQGLRGYHVPRSHFRTSPFHVPRLLDDVSVGIPFDAVRIARFRIQHDEFVSLPSEGTNESLRKGAKNAWSTLKHAETLEVRFFDVSNEAYSAT